MNLGRGGCTIHEMKYDFSNISELSLAALNNSYEDIDDLVNAGCDINYNGTSFSYDIVYDNDYYGEADEDADYEFVDTNATTVTIVISGITALHIGANYGYNETVKELLTIPNIELDMITNYGATPLGEASGWGYSNIISMLAAAGADINHQDIGGYTPLHITSAQNHLEAAKLLISLGANLDTLTYRDGNTALILAAVLASPPLVQLLVDSGARLDIVNVWNGTALDYAVNRNNTEIIQILTIAGEEEEFELLNWNDL